MQALVKPSHNQMKAIALLTIANVCWALPPTLGKLMGTAISPVFIASFRLMVASVLLVVIFLPNPQVREEFRKVWRLSRNEKWLLVLGGALEGIHYVLYFESLRYTTASSVAILINMGNIFVAVWGFSLFKEKLTPRIAIAILLAIIGTLLIISPSTNGESSPGSEGGYNWIRFYGDVLIILSMLLYSVYVVVSKKLVDKTGPVSLVVVMFFIGSVVLIPFAIPDIINAGSYSTQAWIFLLIITLFGSAIGYYTFTVGLKYTDMSTAGVLSLTSPVFAVFFAVLFVPGEILSALFIVGTVIMLLSVAFISISYSKALPADDVKASPSKST